MLSPEASYERSAKLLVDDLYAFEFPAIPGVEIGTAYRPAADLAKVGGDLIDVYRFNNGSFAISIADISGKGIHAATRAASVKHALRAYVSAGFTPAQVLRNLNVLYMETSNFEHRDLESFVTIFLGIADPEHRFLTYASAGHQPIALLSESAPALFLPPTGPIVGILEEWRGMFHQRLVSLAPKSTLIVTTDGVSEARSRSGEFFFQDAMLEVMERNRANSAQDQARSLLEGALQFCEMCPHDDIAIVTARFN